MKNRKLTLGIYFITVLLITLVGTVLRTVSALKHLDFGTGYYSNNLYITVSGWLIAVAVIIGFTYLFFGDSKTGLIAKFDGSATYIPSAAVAVALLFMAVGLLAKAFSGPSVSWLTLVAALFTVPAIAGFFLTVLKTHREDEGRAWFCIAIVIFLVVYSAYLYFDSSLPINSPNKTVDRMAYLAAAAFFLFETRISLGREKWGAYTTFGIIGAAVCLYSALPALTVYILKGEVISNSLYESVLTLAIFAFITARLTLVLIIPEDKESAFVAFIKENEPKAKEAHHTEQAVVDDRDDNYSIDFNEGTERT